MGQNRKKIELLSFPIDDLTVKETFDRTSELIRSTSRESSRKSAALISLDSMIDALSSPLHSSHKDIREADLLMCHGAALKILSRCLDAPIHETVDEEALLNKVLRQCSIQGKSVFFLNLRQEDIERVRNGHPDLEIAGADEIKGSGTDRDLIKAINFSSADVLIAASLKGEILRRLEDIRKNLDIPLFLQFSSDFQKGSWKRKISSLCVLFKLIGFAFPLIVYHQYLRLLFKDGEGMAEPVKTTTSLLQNPSFSISTLTLPVVYAGKEADRLIPLLQSSPDNRMFIFDFSKTAYLDPAALGSMMHFFNAARKLGREVFLIELTDSIRLLLKFHAVWDLIADQAYRDRKTLMDAIQKKHPQTRLAASIDFSPHCCFVRLFGQLDTEQDLEALFMQIILSINDKNCVVDLSGCSFLDSSGICFLLKLRKRMIEKDNQLILSGLSSTLNQILQVAKVRDLFTVNLDPKFSMQLAEKESHKNTLAKKGQDRGMIGS